VFKVAGLEEGIYRYLPVEHQILPISQPARLSSRITEAALGQEFAGKSAVTFIWTVIPYRMEWRYDIAHIIALMPACSQNFIPREAIHSELVLLPHNQD
jgi:hypothetical protein